MKSRGAVEKEDGQPNRLSCVVFVFVCRFETSQFFGLDGKTLHRVEFECLFDLRFRPLSAEAADLASSAQVALLQKLQTLPSSPSAAAASGAGVYRAPGSSSEGAAKLRALREAQVCLAAERGCCCARRVRVTNTPRR